RAVVVFNTLSWPRSGLATRTLTFPDPGMAWLALSDEAGNAVPFLAEGIRWHPDQGGGGREARGREKQSLASVTITFRAEVPALGYRSYWVRAGTGSGGEPDSGGEPGSGSEPGSGGEPGSGAGPEAGAGWTAMPGTVIANEAFEVAADPAR